MDIELYLPWPPTINDYYGSKKAGKRKITYIKPKGKAFRLAVEAAVAEQVGYLQLDMNLLVEVKLFAPDNRRRDLDNYMKALLDACTHAKLWDDDSQIDQLFIYRGLPLKNGLVIMSINEAGPVFRAQKSPAK